MVHCLPISSRFAGMKTLAGFILLLIMLFNLTGISLVFNFQKARLRREMKAQIKGHIPKDQLHKFSVDSANDEHIHWTRRGKELMMNGEMYDVVSVSRENDSIHYYCINDSEETELFAQLDEMVKKKMKEERRTGKQTGKLLRALTSLVYIGVDNQFWFDDHHERAHYYVRVTATPVAPYLEYITPPPRLS